MGAMFAGLILVIYPAILWYMYLHFEKLEHQEMTQEIHHVRSILEDDTKKLDRAVRDWADWDESYRFIQGLNGEFPEKELSTETIVNQNVNVMLFVRPDGSVAIDRGVDLIGRSEKKVSNELAQQLVSYIKLGEHAEEFMARGVFEYQGTLGLVAIKPIRTSAHSGPVQGHLVWARFLDQKEKDRIGRLMGCDVDWHPYQKGVFPENVDAQLDKTGLGVWKIDSSSAKGIGLESSIDNNSRYVLQATMERNIVQHGLLVIATLGGAFLVVGVAGALLFLLFLHRVILTRIESLNQQVEHIKESENFSQIDIFGGNDEITLLSQKLSEVFVTNTRMKDRLRKQKKYLETILENQKEMIVRLDQEGEVLYANESFCRFIGKDPKELNSKDFLCLFPLEVAICLSQLIEQQKQGASEEVTLCIDLKDGGIAWHTWDVQTLSYEERTEYQLSGTTSPRSSSWNKNARALSKSAICSKTSWRMSRSSRQ